MLKTTPINSHGQRRPRQKRCNVQRQNFRDTNWNVFKHHIKSIEPGPVIHYARHGRRSGQTDQRLEHEHSTSTERLDKK